MPISPFSPMSLCVYSVLSSLRSVQPLSISHSGQRQAGSVWPMAIGRTWWCLLFSSSGTVATGHRRLCPLTVAAAPCACAADHDSNDAQFAELGELG